MGRNASERDRRLSRGQMYWRATRPQTTKLNTTLIPNNAREDTYSPPSRTVRMKALWRKPSFQAVPRHRSVDAETAIRTERHRQLLSMEVPAFELRDVGVCRKLDRSAERPHHAQIPNGIRLLHSWLGQGCRRKEIKSKRPLP